MKYFWYAGNAMAARLDFGAGMLVVLLLVYGLGLTPTIQILPLLELFGGAPLWVFTPHILWLLPIGSFFALFPDLDIVSNIWRRTEVNFNHHETLWHRPVWVLSLAFLIGYMLLGTFFATVAVSGIFWHYLHDTKGFGGCGITWFWPISRLYWGPTGTGVPKDSDNDPEYYKRWLDQEAFTLVEIGLGMLATWFTVWLVFGSSLLSFVAGGVITACELFVDWCIIRAWIEYKETQRNV
jgi:hypothetical protein